MAKLGFGGLAKTYLAMEGRSMRGLGKTGNLVPISAMRRNILMNFQILCRQVGTGETRGRYCVRGLIREW